MPAAESWPMRAVGTSAQGWKASSVLDEAIELIVNRLPCVSRARPVGLERPVETSVVTELVAPSHFWIRWLPVSAT